MGFMKTEQEQIKEMSCILTMLINCGGGCMAQYCHLVDNYAKKLIEAGYGDVSEYKAEREMLGSQIKVLKQRLNDKYIEIDNLNRDYNNAFERLKSQQREIERLKAENACLLKACEGQFTFDTTENKKYSVFNSVRKEFADEVKAKLLAIFGKTICSDLDTEDITDIIDELLEEYEK